MYPRPIFTIRRIHQPAATTSNECSADEPTADEHITHQYQLIHTDTVADQHAGQYTATGQHAHFYAAAADQYCYLYAAATDQHIDVHAYSAAPYDYKRTDSNINARYLQSCPQYNR